MLSKVPLDGVQGLFSGCINLNIEISVIWLLSFRLKKAFGSDLFGAHGFSEVYKAFQGN